MRTEYGPGAGRSIFLNVSATKGFDAGGVSFGGNDAYFPLTDRSTSKSFIVKVRSSRNYRPGMRSSDFNKRIVAAGWFVLSYENLERTDADVLSLVLRPSDDYKVAHFLNIKPDNLLNRLKAIHGNQSTFHLYMWVMKIENYPHDPEGSCVCVDGRGVTKGDKEQILVGNFGNRDLTQHLDCWNF